MDGLSGTSSERGFLLLRTVNLLMCDLTLPARGAACSRAQLAMSPRLGGTPTSTEKCIWEIVPLVLTSKCIYLFRVCK